MALTKILFVCTEMEPYLPVSEVGIGAIVKALSHSVQDRGHDVRAFMPRYGSVSERRNQLHEVIRLSGMNLVIGGSDHSLIIKVASLPTARMQVYFIDNDDYFQRKSMLYDEDGKYFEDNDERCIFFVRGVLETVKKLRWPPDIVHCHGWFSALLPFYVKKSYKDNPLFVKTKIILSIYNEGFSLPLREGFKDRVMMDGIKNKDLEILEDPCYENLMKLAIQYSDAVIMGDSTIHEGLIEYSRKLKKPVLEYQGENYVDAYNSFYDQIMAR
jgi:starch synthase